MASKLVRIFGLFTCCREPLIGSIFGEGSRIIELGSSLAIFKLRESVGRTIIIIKRMVSQIMPKSLGVHLIFILWVLNSLDTFFRVRRALLKVILKFHIFKILGIRFNPIKNIAFLRSLRLSRHIRSMPNGNILD